MPDARLKANFTIGKDTAKPFKDTHVRQLALMKRLIPDYRISNIDKDAVWVKISEEIKPYLALMPKFRAECVYKYLHNRFYYFLDYFR